MAREVRIQILGDSRDWSRAVDSADRDARRLDGAMGRVGRGAGMMGAAIAGGVAVGGVALAAFGASAISIAEEAQQVGRQTDAVIRSMNATWTNTAAIEKYAEKLSALVGADDELIQSGQNILLTFGQVQNRVGEGNDIFDRATAAALDMSTALGTDMNSAAMMVGKALNDPIRGLTALRRSGIQFTAQQEEQIRTMTEAGDTLGAQRIMIAELERQFGGSAAAQSTASGRLAVAWENLQEKLGEKLLPIFEKVVNWLIRVMPGALATAERWFNQFQAGLAVVVAWVEANWPKIQEVITQVMTKAQEIIGTVIGYVQGAWATFGDDIIRIATGAFQAVQNIVQTVMGVIQGIMNVVMGIIHGDWSQVWEGIKGIAISVWDGIKGAVVAAVNFISGVVGAFGNAIASSLARVWEGVRNGFRSAINWIIDRWNGLDFTFEGFDIPGPGPNIPGFTIGLPDIPRLASGGIVNSPTLALIGEAGPEAVVPLDGNHGVGPVHVQVILDGNAIVDSLVRYNRNSGPIRIKVA